MTEIYKITTHPWSSKRWVFREGRLGGGGEGAEFGGRGGGDVGELGIQKLLLF